MTLEKSNNIKQFAIKRFIRLWPTLLICCLVTFAVLGILPFRGMPTHIKYFLPSLTITQPHMWERLFNLNSMDYIDGVEWSLVCEISFYIVASVLYFINRKCFFRNWLIFVSALMGFYFSQKLLGLSRIDNYLSPLLFPTYMAYFTAGIYLYFLYAKQKLKPAYHIATMLLLDIQLVFLQQIKEDIFIICFLGLFMLFIYKPGLVGFFSGRIIAKIGFMSYTLYLLHNCIGIVLINKFAVLFNSRSALVTILPTIAILLLATVGIEKVVISYINPFLKKKLVIIAPQNHQ